MLNTNRLELIDMVAYSLDEIKAKSDPEEHAAFMRWFNGKPHHLSTDGRKCILASDLQLYVRLRTNALKSMKA